MPFSIEALTDAQEVLARGDRAAIERWGARSGCSEFASDALLENELGHSVHEALGFRETERVVYFFKPIDRNAT